MELVLVVVRPFGPYSSGDTISDPAVIAAVLAGENAANVVRAHAAPKEG